MKTLLFFTGTILSAITIMQADAATKCMPFHPYNRCHAHQRVYDYSSDWTAQCDYTNDKSIDIRGIAVCSSTPPTGLGSNKSNLYLSYTLEENKYCYCRMISPAVSQWAHTESPSIKSASTCNEGCAAACVANIDDIDMKQGLFSNLSD